MSFARKKVQLVVAHLLSQSCIASLRVVVGANAHSTHNIGARPAPKACEKSFQKGAVDHKVSVMATPSETNLNLVSQQYFNGDPSHGGHYGKEKAPANRNRGAFRGGTR